MPQQIQQGDEVKFRDRRGREVTGVVTNLKVHTHRKANRLAAQLGINHHHETEVAEVKPDGVAGVYRVPLTMLQLTGKKRQNDLSRARIEVGNILQQRSDIQHQRAASGREQADQKGLYDLKPGAKVKVQFRNGFKECTFIKLSAAGRAYVRTEFGRELWTPAQFVSPMP